MVAAYDARQPAAAPLQDHRAPADFALEGLSERGSVAQGGVHGDDSPIEGVDDTFAEDRREPDRPGHEDPAFRQQHIAEIGGHGNMGSHVATRRSIGRENQSRIENHEDHKRDTG